MANLTITVDAGVLKRARIKALHDDISVNQYLAEQLEKYVADDEAERIKRDKEGAEKYFALIDSFGPHTAHGRFLTRDEIYAERLDRFPKR